MTSISRHLRSLLIALAVLALTATVAFAARPDTSPSAHADAHVPSATGTPEAGDDTGTDQPEAPDTDAPETEKTDAATPDTTDAHTAEHPDNHGKLVSEAAQAATPAGYDNHGAWVRTVAKDNHGHSAEAAAARQARKTKP